ncbi:hypothetical protein PTSG_12117 [Salpingoeca rosetta]|uniref:Uncharacterized protein n=1 Tax=Salpingoeca rosetta (strain ATCC 50818 / BSB-021) TaxID=946362 RepID=F2U7K6_SALR5|nr:uncharacterized protein PTSG_12117 [Salpingoeca rosetta]EGD83423.1 hypothetical protein PTSG_12117 [Salpingoeca rosetta]|eukprot:XP_004994927.1 hypothetical protein PTSG_12117 [Salpingoeca rosetta]
MMPVVPLHTALSANEQVDALVSKHWSVFGSCVQQGGGFQNDVCADSGRSGRAVIASCSNMVWSPTNPHATFDLRKATQGH